MAEPYFASIGIDYWELDDSEKRHKEHPDTYSIPKKRDRETLEPADIVKLSFSTITFDKDNIPIMRNERMWVKVQKVQKDRQNIVINKPIYYGILVNECILNENLGIGLEVWFEPRHIMNITRAKEYASTTQKVHKQFLRQLEKQQTLESKKNSLLDICTDQFGQLTDEIKEYLMQVSSTEEVLKVIETSAVAVSLLDFRCILLGRKGTNRNNYLEGNIKNLIRRQEEKNYEDYLSILRSIYSEYKDELPVIAAHNRRESPLIEFIVEFEQLLMSLVGSQILYSKRPSDIEMKLWFMRFLESLLELEISLLQKNKGISNTSDLEENYLKAFSEIAQKLRKEPVEAWNILMKLNLKLGLGLHPINLE